MAHHSDISPVVGIWDLNEAPLSLGGLLILAAELHMQRIIHGANIAQICLLGDPVKHGEQGREVISAVVNLDGVDGCFLCHDLEDLQTHLTTRTGGFRTWPPFERDHLTPHRYESTLFSQEFFYRHGFVPHLACKPELVSWAATTLRKHVGPRLPVVVHLKNNQRRGTNESNADFGAWRAFMADCLDRDEFLFILIGNEEIDPRLRELPNTLVARDVGSNLARDLALVQLAFAFMGMASGPCQMALYSGTPYVVYKNPDHHSDEMARELGQADRFPFASQGQKIVRMFETRDNLWFHFNELLEQADRQSYRRRLARLWRTRTG